MDLDSSLDDIIRKRSKSRPQTQSQSPRNAPVSRRPALGSGSGGSRYSGGSSGSSRHDNSRPRSTHHAVHPKSRTIGKPTISKPNPAILRRINPVPGGGFVTKKQPISTASLSHRLGNKSMTSASSGSDRKLDPSQIVITKSTGRRHEDSAGSSSRRYPAASAAPIVRDRRDYGVSGATGASLSTITAPAQQQPQASSSFSIRGLAGASAGGGLSIRGEAGPSIVLISNLDPGANAEDVKTACMQFGTVLRCDVLLDPSGRSYGEAEVEFANKAAALECIQKLDNEIADGRILRATLRSRPHAPMPPPQQQRMQHHHHHPTPPSPAPPLGHFASTTLRSVIAPTRSGYTSAASATGKLYSDQMMLQQTHHDYARFPPPPPRRY